MFSMQKNATDFRFPVHLSFALPWARQGSWPAQGTRKALHKQKWGKKKGDGGWGKRAEIWEKELFIHSP